MAVHRANSTSYTLHFDSRLFNHPLHSKLSRGVLLLHEQAGMPAGDVLAAASWGARAWLGFPGLVEGGLADLVVYDADPRTDLRAVAAPRRIILRGRVIR